MNLSLNDDDLVASQLREAARKHAYGGDAERFLRKVLCRALYDLGALSSSADAQVTEVERVKWLVKHGISGKPAGERAPEEVDRMLALLGEARPGDQAPPERG
jgi:hypothetical protein